jgi:hypothetical protein
MPPTPKEGIMPQLKPSARSPQRSLPLTDSGQPHLWSSLTNQQQQRCRQWLSQLLVEVLRHEKNQLQPERNESRPERINVHER